MGRGSTPAPAMQPLVAVLLLAAYTKTNMLVSVEGSSWCIARSESSSSSLQMSLDYACASGADCGPIQLNGLCYLPNNLQAHASYAFNSYYQRSNYAPGSCDFAGTATVTVTDPSYGSCNYPATPSSAGVLTPPSTNAPGVVTNAPITNPPGNTTNGGGDAGGIPSGFSPSTIGDTSGNDHKILLSKLISCWILLLFI